MANPKYSLKSLYNTSMASRNFYKSWDHGTWLGAGHFPTKMSRTVTSVSLEKFDADQIRNGWFTIGDDNDEARYQQKQLAEREMKIASLYEAQQARALGRVRAPTSGSTGSGVNGNANSPPAQTVSMAPGKVRQMFEERRTKAGIDKSYPLQPIHNNTDRGAPKRSLPNGYTKVAAKTPAQPAKVAVINRKPKQNTLTNLGQRNKLSNLSNGAGDLNHNHRTDINANKQNTMSLKNGVNADETDGMIANETFPEAMEPAPTPRSPEVPEPKRPVARNPVKNPSPKPKVVATPRKTISDNAVPVNNKGRGVMQRLPNPTGQINNRKSPLLLSKTSSLIGQASSTPGQECSVCGRKFAPDRIERHEQICRKAANAKKRKPFDALKHRLQGTEAEPFINKIRKSTNVSSTNVKPLNSTWRKNHEEFVSAIRAAKQVQAHLKSGGKLSDLPPPAPSLNPDYVQCPSCKRRFNKQAAERHIPKCASFQFNKSKPSNRR